MTVGGEGGGGNQDFELNLAPIIDAFTVLITYLLVSASFLTLTVFDVGVSANGEASAEQTNPSETPMTMEILLSASKEVALKVTGGAEKLDMTIPIAAINGNWDLDALNARIQQAVQRYPALVDASLSAESPVRYKEIIRVIESVKKVMPKIFLAG
jgi:biopolymer transport protein ExbD